MSVSFSLDYSCLSLREFKSIFPCDCRFQYFALLLINWHDFVFRDNRFRLRSFILYAFRFSSIMNREACTSLASDPVVKVCNFTFWIYHLLVLWLIFISLLPSLVFPSSARRGNNVRDISRTVQSSAINVGVWDVENRNEDHSCVNNFSRPGLPPQILRCRHFLMILLWSS